jgi:hypothetical protein
MGHIPEDLNTSNYFTACSVLATSSLPSTTGVYTAFLDMLGYKEMRLPTSLQETVLSKSLLDQSCLWGYLGRIQERYNAGWITSIWKCGVFPETGS